jgi:RNA-binding protein
VKNKDLKKKAVDIKPTIQVGKAGFNDSIKDELRSQFDSRELIKIKVLRSSGPSSYWKEQLEVILVELKAELIDIKGNTAVVFKRSNKPKK